MKENNTGYKFLLSEDNKKDLTLMLIDIIALVVISATYILINYNRVVLFNLFEISENLRFVISMIAVLAWSTFSVVLGRNLSIKEDDYKSVATIISASANRDKEISKMTPNDAKNYKVNFKLNKVITVIQLIVMILAGVTLSYTMYYNDLLILNIAAFIINIICYLISLKIKNRKAFDCCYTLFSILLIGMICSV